MIKSRGKIVELVEQYGAADEAEKKAKAAKKEAAEEIKELLEVGDSARSKHFLLEVRERVGRVISNQKVLKAIGSKRYAEISNPSVTKLTDEIGKAEVDKLTESFTHTKTLHPKRHK
jgi:hypothetical protein